jgi:hypothetical protein
MTSPKVITGMAFLLLVGLVLSYGLGGIWFGSTTASIFGSLKAYQTYEIFGIFKIPWVNVDFFTVGIPKLLSFNFAFFGGSYEFFRYLAYVFSIGVVWGIVGLAIGVIGNFWSKR